MDIKVQLNRNFVVIIEGYTNTDNRDANFGVYDISSIEFCCIDIFPCLKA